MTVVLLLLRGVGMGGSDSGATGPVAGAGQLPLVGVGR